MSKWDFLKYYIDQLGKNSILSGITIAVVVALILLLGYITYLYIPHALRERSKNLENSRNVHKEINSLYVVDDDGMIKIKNVATRIENITLFYEIEHGGKDLVFKAKKVFLTPENENLLFNNTGNRVKSFDIQYKKTLKRKYIQFRYSLIKRVGIKLPILFDDLKHVSDRRKIDIENKINESKEAISSFKNNFCEIFSLSKQIHSQWYDLKVVDIGSLYNYQIIIKLNDPEEKDMMIDFSLIDIGRNPNMNVALDYNEIVFIKKRFQNYLEEKMSEYQNLIKYDCFTEENSYFIFEKEKINKDFIKNFDKYINRTIDAIFKEKNFIYETQEVEYYI